MLMLARLVHQEKQFSPSEVKELGKVILSKLVQPSKQPRQAPSFVKHGAKLVTLEGIVTDLRLEQ